MSDRDLVVVQGMPLSPKDRPPLTRAWSWVAILDNGMLYREVEWRSLANIKPIDQVRRITLFRTGDALTEKAQVAVFIPEGAKPIAFYRTQVAVNPGAETEQYAVIGYIKDGHATYAWVNDAGDVVVTDRDLSDFQ